jgi:hypothetical protein
MRDSAGHTPDLRFWKSELFCAAGLDTISENRSHGQISPRK